MFHSTFHSVFVLQVFGQSFCQCCQTVCSVSSITLSLLFVSAMSSSASSVSSSPVLSNKSSMLWSWVQSGTWSSCACSAGSSESVLFGLFGLHLHLSKLVHLWSVAARRQPLEGAHFLLFDEVAPSIATPDWCWFPSFLLAICFVNCNLNFSKLATFWFFFVSTNCW